jgi:hypothetical protein
MKKISLILFYLIFVVSVSYSQDMAKLFNMQEDIGILENRINKLLKKHHSLSKIKGLRQFHIFLMGHDSDIRKEDYLDHSFLYKLVPSYIEETHCILKRKKYLRFQTLVCDSTGKLVAIGDNRFIPFVSHDKNKIDLVRMFYDKKLDFVFYMGHKLGTHIGIKKNDIYVLINSSEGLKVYPLKEFVDCCYDDLMFHPSSYKKK